MPIIETCQGCSPKSGFSQDGAHEFKPLEILLWKNGNFKGDGGILGQKNTLCGNRLFVKELRNMDLPKRRNQFSPRQQLTISYQYPNGIIKPAWRRGRMIDRKG